MPISLQRRCCKNSWIVEQTDAIFKNLKAFRAKYVDDPLQISVATKAKVSLGEYVQGGKTRTDRDGKVEKGWDHDPPAEDKLVPLGILVMATGMLSLFFGNHEKQGGFGYENSL